MVFPVQAATIPIASIPVGKVISLGGLKFVKIGTDAQKGSRFIAASKALFLPPNTQLTPDCPRERVIGTMQTWNSCASLAKPAAAAYTDIGCLIDERDGKTYEIRKFADNKCWMVDNLMYGGADDNCAGVGAAGYTDATYGGAKGMASPSNRFGAGTYGNCRDPRVGGSSPCTASSTACGYMYNWQAAIQLPSAYYSSFVTYPNGTPSTTNFVQGICPSGWHLPSGGNTAATSEFSQLDIANGGTGNNENSNGGDTVSLKFWRPRSAYKGVYAGGTSSDGSQSGYNVNFSQWSASEAYDSEVFYFYGNDFYVHVGTTLNTNKNYGKSVRCIKD